MKYLAPFALSLLVTTTASAVDLNAKAYYIIEPSTNTVVLEKNADMQIPPASLTKMMTVHLAFDALKNGELTLETKLPVSERAWRKKGSKMFVEVGKEVALEDLIKGILVSSGNDATIVVAEYLAGTEEAFAEMMNEKAQDIGMFNTSFRNASGWPHPEQLTTAKDMTKLAESLVESYPEYYKFFGLERFTFSNISQPNRNGLLRRNMGVDGMKTGHIEEAGYHLTASAERNGVRLISTVLGTSSSRQREDQTLAGLSYSFRSHEMKTIVEKQHIIEQSAPVLLGESESITVLAAEPLTMYLPKRNLDYTIEAIVPNPLPAPIQAGEKVGVVRVTFSNGQVRELDAVAGNSVAALAGVQKIWQKFKNKLAE